jgi:hypothetical protein
MGVVMYDWNCVPQKPGVIWTQYYTCNQTQLNKPWTMSAPFLQTQAYNDLHEFHINVISYAFG